MIYHTADNTLFDIKEAKYDFNLDRYKTEKRNYLIFSVIFSVLLICILLFLKNQVFLNLIQKTARIVLLETNVQRVRT